MISAFLKKLRSKILEIRIEDILWILIAATIAMVIATIVNPQLTAPRYGAGKLPLHAYFDTFVRYGTFVFIYFTLIPVLILWLGKKFFKERWGSKIAGFLLAGSLAGLAAVYFILPGPMYGNPLKIPWLNYLAGVSAGTDQKFTDTGQNFCGKRLDFFYSAGCSVNKVTDTLEIIKDKLEKKKDGAKFYSWCMGGESPCAKRKNQKITCEAYEKGEYTLEDVKKLQDAYRVKHFPALVLGCKYIVWGNFSYEDYKRALCDKLGECDL